MIKSKNNMENILKATKTSLELSTIHAIPNIIRSESTFFRTLWFICFVISTGWCGWFVNKTLTDYLQFEVVSKTEITYETQMKLPVVSICNLNPFTGKINEMIKIRYPKLNAKLHYGAKVAEQIRAKSFIENPILEKEISNSYNISNFLISCLFDYFQCENNFTKYYDVAYGYCYRLNLNQTMFLGGLLNSLKLELYTDITTIQNDNIFSTDNGFNIFISNQSDLDSNNMEGISIPLGYSTKIALNRQVMRKEPKPYSKCTKDLNSIDSYNSEVFKKTFASRGVYFYVECVRLCLQKYFNENCGCRNLYFPRYSDEKMLRNCFIDDNLNDVICISNGYFNFSRNLDYLNSCDCPLECEKTSYTYTISYAEFPTKNYADYLLETYPFLKSKVLNDKFNNNSDENNKYQILRKSLARVEIFYDELKQTVISENVKMELSDMVSNIGGVLGLFLGLSFLSLFELVEIILNIFIIVFKEAIISKTDRVNSI